MSPELAFKLGQLIGTFQDFIVRVKLDDIRDADIDRVECLMKDVQKKFFNESSLLTAKGSCV